MGGYLKQSTAHTFRIGPFLDETDGVTAETGLSIAQADIQISKNGGAFAQTSDATPTTTHDTDGWYQCPLTASDTDTLGSLTVQIVMSGAVPVWAEFNVVTANWYDTMFSTDQLDVNVTNIEGSDATDQINAACDTALTDYDAVVPADLPTNFGDLSITATTGRVDVDSIGGTSQTANDNGADINAILADTDEMQGKLPSGIIAAGIQKNVAKNNIGFVMVDETDHVSPKTGLTVSAEVSKDAGAFASASGSVTEISDGWYQFDAAQADMNADILIFRFTATGADTTHYSIITSS